MAEEEVPKAKGKGGGKPAEKVHPAVIYAEDMTEDWSKDAVKAARDAFAQTIPGADVHAAIADLIRKKFDRDHGKRL